MKKIFVFFIACLIFFSAAAQPFISANIHEPEVAIQDRSLPALTDTIDTNPYALIGGGSKGIGYAIAEALAKRNYNLILIARHKDSLISAKAKLESAYHVHVEILQYDLSLENAATEIAAWCTEKNLPVKVLCNVAGIGGAKDYLSLSLDSLRYMVNLNVSSGMALSLTMLPILEKNTPAYILNVASMAGLAPIPAKNMYSATKSAVVFFSYSLRYQLKEKNISVSVLCPGPVYTKPEIEIETKKKLGFLGKLMVVKVKRVGEVAVRKTLNGKLVIIPGTMNRIISWVVRALPRRWIVYIYGKLGG